MSNKVFFKTPLRCDGASGKIQDILIAPRRIVEVFGDVDNLEETEKVSRVWTFVDHHGKYYEIRDWKCTNVYDPDLPSPDDFWQSNDPTYIDICADVRLPKEDKQEFVQWVISRLNQPQV